jgi:hypothetical protein
VLDTGFSEADLRVFNRLLVSNHAIDVVVQLLDLDHRYVSDLSTRLLTGQVTIDDEADTTRAMTMDLMDPFHQLKLDPDSPDDGALFFNRMVKVSYGVLSPDRFQQFYVPVFCGPITDLTRNTAAVSLTCKGKEVLLSSNLWTAKTYKKGTKKTNAIINLLRYVGGETKYQIPDLPDRFTKDWTVTKETSAWAAAKALAKGMGYQLFYDGRGTCIMRKKPGSSIFTFSDKGALLTTPQPKYNVDTSYNAVEVTGGVPTGSKTNVWWRVVAPANHPLAPAKLGRNGVPRYLTLRVSDDNLKTRTACAVRAREELSAALVEAVDVAFDCLPVPHLEEGDYCTVKNDDWSSSFRYTKATIPLTASSASSIGYLKTPFKRTVSSGGSGGGGQRTRRRRRRN